MVRSILRRLTRKPLFLILVVVLMENIVVAGVVLLANEDLRSYVEASFAGTLQGTAANAEGVLFPGDHVVGVGTNWVTQSYRESAM